jgi:hypothetical protein
MSSVIKITVMVSLAGFVLWQYAYAADPTVITLSCGGTVTGAVDNKPDPIPDPGVGVVVSFVDHTLAFLHYVVPIVKVDTVGVEFGGQSTSKNNILGPTISITTMVSGSLDRVTGAFSATTIMLSQDARPLLTLNWELSCRPTTRLF